MFVGYDLEIRDLMGYAYLTSGNNIYTTMNKTVENEIKRFINDDGSVNATAMQNNWFSEINSDIFISHSSKDKQIAIMLAGWLFEKFGLNSFIDSCLWGHCDDLLMKIDNRYCYNKSSGYYNYKKRNYSTSHVHNMLSTALNAMIDKCECIIFLNTKNSIKDEEDIFKITESPWIYNELSTIKTIRKSKPSYVEISRCYSSRSDIEDEFPNFEYQIEMSNLIKINFSDILKWEKIYKSYYKGLEHPLLILYHFTGARKFLWGEIEPYVII